MAFLVLVSTTVAKYYLLLRVLVEEALLHQSPCAQFNGRSLVTLVTAIRHYWVGGTS
jgi:hypothetical protein